MRRSYKIVSRSLLALYFIKVKVTGKEQIDKNKCYVLISNHQSSLDILANAATSPVLYKYLAKAEIQKIPIMGFVVQHVGVYVDRKNLNSRKTSFNNMKRALERGYSVLVYPEGTRNRTDQKLMRFFDGAFRLAILTKTPIIVETIVNSGKLASPKKSFDLCPGTMVCRFDTPIETGNLSIEDLPELKEKVREMMLSHLVS